MKDNELQIIEYTINKTKDKIVWSASENFNELRHIVFSLDRMEAKEIEKINELSIRAKLLLSAVAGAIIQHLLDQGYSAQTIFATGKFTVR